MVKPVRNVRLKALIYDGGYTIRTFAAKVGIHEKYLSGIISGRMFPSEELQKKIKAALRTKEKLF